MGLKLELISLETLLKKKGYECICDCGSKSYHDATYLNQIKNKTNFGCKQCYRLKKYEFKLVNKKYGELTILRKINQKNKFPKIEAICSCGNKIIRDQRFFKRKKHIKSCGCLKNRLLVNRKILPPGVAARNTIMSSYKSAAKNRNLSWKLSILDFVKITNENCFYCGNIPSTIQYHRKSFYIYNGIDRVDNSKGYIKSNVVSCCFNCNNNKRAISLNIVDRVLEFLKNGQLYTRPE
jgi:hypothetical protein